MKRNTKLKFKLEWKELDGKQKRRKSIHFGHESPYFSIRILLSFYRLYWSQIRKNLSIDWSSHSIIFNSNVATAKIHARYFNIWQKCVSINICFLGTIVKDKKFVHLDLRGFDLDLDLDKDFSWFLLSDLDRRLRFFFFSCSSGIYNSNYWYLYFGLKSVIFSKLKPF